MKNLKAIPTALIATSCLLFSPLNSKAQDNALTLNGAYIVMNGGTETENINLVVNQSSDLGIVRSSKGGHIHSENQYNTVKWVTKNETGEYIFPFGVGGNATDIIPFTFNKTAGSSSVSVSTWGTDELNSPKPEGVTNMSGKADSVLYAVDRFWDIQATGNTADLTFSYLGTENTTVNPSNNLMAQHWGGSAWDAQVGPGTAGVTTGVGEAGPFVGQNDFSPWMLTSRCTPTINDLTETICQGDSILIGSDWQTVAGVYSDTIVGGDVLGCDSIVKTTLIVNTVDVTTTTSGATITANANAPATYQWIDCNDGNSIIPGETGQSFTATVNGDYAVIVTEDGCTDTSACVNINNVGIEAYNLQNSISVYPNPANEEVNVVIDNFDATTQLKLIDNLGKIVYEIKPTSNVSIIDLQSLPKGVYTIVISTESNTVNKKLIKQ